MCDNAASSNEIMSSVCLLHQQRSWLLFYFSTLFLNLFFRCHFLLFLKLIPAYYMWINFHHHYQLCSGGLVIKVILWVVQHTRPERSRVLQPDESKTTKWVNMLGMGVVTTFNTTLTWVVVFITSEDLAVEDEDNGDPVRYHLRAILITAFAIKSCVSVGVWLPTWGWSMWSMHDDTMVQGGWTAVGMYIPPG